MDQPTPPTELVERIACGKCVAVVGSGLSRGAGLPDWRGALEKIISWADIHGHEVRDRDEISKLLGESPSDLLMLASELADQLGPERYRRALTEIFRPPLQRPTRAHENLVAIPFTGVITTNYDKLVEIAWNIAGLSNPVICTHAQNAELGGIVAGDHPFILKAHGNIDQFETVILGRPDYQSLLTRGAYRECMSFLCAHYTWLFLGFSLNDPDLRLTLDTLQGTFGGHTASHYALLPKKEAGSIVVRRLQRDNNITVLSYDPSDDSHREVAHFLDVLQGAVRRRQLGETPVMQFVTMQKSAESGLADLNQNRVSIGDAEYLRGLVRLARTLWDGGAHRQAWTSVTGSFERMNSALRDDAERIEIGMEVARMVLEDAGAMRATSVLLPLMSVAEHRP